MRNRILSIITLLSIAEVLYASVQFGITQGTNKWGYAGEHCTLTRPVPSSKKLEVAVELKLEKGSTAPIPRESWFGIYLEDTKQHTRYIWGFCNLDWGDIPKTLVPSMIFWDNGGNMQRKTFTNPSQAEGEYKLTLKLSNGKLYAGYESSMGAMPYSEKEYNVPEDFAPDKVGITVDCYHAKPVVPIKFRTLTMTTENQTQKYYFSESELWHNSSSRAILTWNDATTLRVDESLQEKISVGKNELFIPQAHYIVQNLKIPGNTTLRFAPGTRIQISGFIELTGDNITIDGACFEYAWHNKPLIVAKNRSNLRFQNCSTATWNGTETNAIPYKSGGPILFSLTNCSDIILANGAFADLSDVLNAKNCSRIIVRDNKAERCRTLTTVADGSDFLNHVGNWSRNVVYQCMWWGGDSNDTKSNVTPGTARIVKRDSKFGSPNVDNHVLGTYDINVQNNFAEHGTTLVWGSKGRNIVISGNIARYMNDMAYDTEGGENVIISDNISINSACAGIGCYFYGERILISNNQVLIFEEGTESQRGNFVRLHSGGSPTHFGNGQILVTGNQFIAETGKKRTFIVETAREIFIKGNTFRNGVIVATNQQAERIVISGNDFETTLQNTGSAVVLTGGKEHVISGNLFKLRGNDAAPALNLANHNARIFISGNLFIGWNLVYELSQKTPGKLLFVGNQYEGKIGSDNSWSVIKQNNISIK
ncbi:hypothetical protein [uncultured Victivallis sp.]|uniref:hypothetical protein n=1 Tax=uncultured Victivallis sp. TaxID=354118 RepID=UPI0025E04AA4|nr:hypothetical protein [uncultured Victivallis sp.]